MALLQQHPRHPRAEAARAFAIDAMAALIDRQLGPAGVHTEDSPEYHFFATNAIERILLAPWGQIEALAPFHAKLALARQARDWLVDPAGRGLPVGDSTETVLVRDFAGLEALAAPAAGPAPWAPPWTATAWYAPIPRAGRALGDAVPDRELPRRRTQAFGLPQPDLAGGGREPADRFGEIRLSGGRDAGATS